MALLINSYQEVSIDYLAVTLKYDNGVGKQCCSPKDHQDLVRWAYWKYIEHKLDLTRPDKSRREKHE